MHIIRLLLIMLFSYQCTLSFAEKASIPIMGFFGVPDWQTTEENFRVFSECGFDISIYRYPSLELLVKACRYADKHGVKILGQCPEIYDSPDHATTILKKEKGFFGYLVQDEPSVPDIRLRQKEIENILRIDSTHPFYINLHPYYHQEWVEPTLKVKTYQEYLKAASATSCQQISFDFYPITTKGIRPTWYQNLEMVRQESLRTSKPFWGFVLSVPHNVPFDEGNYYPTPTLGSLRLQVYSNLAYGAQAIQYFTYWTPSNEEGFNYHDAPISRDGKKTQTYKLVQQMNRELKGVAPLFYGAKVLSVHHLGAIPEGTTRQNTMPLNIKSLKVVGRQGAIISQFQKGTLRYLAVVNKSHEKTLTLRIQPRNATPRHLTKQLKEEAIKTSYIIPAGDILLFRLR